MITAGNSFRSKGFPNRLAYSGVTLFSAAFAIRMYQLGNGFGSQKQSLHESPPVASAEVSQSSNYTEFSYSRVACVGKESDAVETACYFQNICYASQTKDIQFYAPGTPDSSLATTLPMIPVQFSTAGNKPFIPQVRFEALPHSSSVRRLDKLHIVWNHWAGLNIGHLVWEDFAGMWTLLNTFTGQHSKPNFLVLTKDFHCDERCLELSNSVLGALGGIVLGSAQDYFEEQLSLDVSDVSKLLCFDLIGGAVTKAFVGQEVKSRHFGRETLFYSFREKVLHFHGINSSQSPIEHHIVITDKSQSDFLHSGSKLHRGIYNVKEIYDFLRQQYPALKISVVQWHNMSFQQSLVLLSTITILITPCGGVSTLLPFLPGGAHAVVMDYIKSDVNEPFGGEVGDSMHMEGALWDHFWHLRIDYYAIENDNDYIFDYPGATDTRNDASIIVKPARLKKMVS